MFTCCRSTGAVDKTANTAAASHYLDAEQEALVSANDGIFRSSKQGSKAADATSTTVAEDDPIQVTEAVAVGCMRPGNSFLRRRSNSSNSNINRERKILRIIDEIEAQAALDEAGALYGKNSNVPSDENNDDTHDANGSEDDQSSSREVRQDDEAAMNPFMRYVLNLPEKENVAFVQSSQGSPSVEVVRPKKEQEKDDDLNDNRDEGRNPPLYKPPEKGVQAKRVWLQQAFSPKGAERFPDSPTKPSPSSQRSFTAKPAVASPSDPQDESSSAVKTAVNANAVAAASEGGLVLPSPAPATYMASAFSSQKPQPVTTGYKDCSASPNDVMSYEIWYQKGLLRWRPSRFQPQDAAGSYQHMRSIASLGGSKSDFLQDPLAISPSSAESSSSANATPESAENRNGVDATAKGATSFADKSRAAPPSIPEDPTGGYQHHDSMRAIGAGGAPLQIATNTLPDSRTFQRFRPDPPITSLFSPQKLTTMVAENDKKDAVSSSLSHRTPRNRETVPIVSLFGSPTTPAVSAKVTASLTKRAEYPQHLRASQLSPFEKVEYYATFVDSYKGYVGDRASPEAKSMLRTASQELEQVQVVAAAAQETPSTASEF